MVYRKRKAVHVIIGFVLIITASLAAANFLKTNLEISSYSLVLPKERWLITIGGGGQINSNMFDYTNGKTVLYNITQFERGEFIAMNFTNAISGKKEFSKGDTVIFMISSNIRDQLVTALGEMQIATAKYKSLSSAEKAPLINEAKTKLVYVEEKIKEQKILSDRAKQLFDKGYTSQQEYELQKWSLDLLEIEREIYNSQLENLKTGVKQEELDFIKSEINSAKERMNFLKERESELVVVSPINGKVVNTFSPDTLLNVINSEQIVLQIPVKLSEYPEFRIDQNISISFSEYDIMIMGKVVSIDSEVKMVNQQQVVYVSILADNISEKLLPGMVLQINLQLRQTTMLQQLKRFFVN